MAFNTTVPTDTALTVHLLAASDDSVIMSAITPGTDLTAVTQTALKLRADLSTTNSAVTPVLHDWSISYADPAAACSSDFSPAESSTQCYLVGDLDLNCRVDWTDLGIFALHWFDGLETGPGGENLIFNVADINLDSVVDLRDFALLAANWLDCIGPGCP